MEKMEWTVGQTACRTVGVYLRREAGFSATVLKKVKYGGILRNGEVVNVRAEILPGDRLQVCFPAEESPHIVPMDIPLTLLYEDEYILAADKPTGMPVHPSRGNRLPTLANAVMHYMGAPFVFRAVNRLDRDTSGIVLIAKDMLTAAKLGRDMKEGRIRKEYATLVRGTPAPAEGVIDAPIARETPEGMRRVVCTEGKPAVTRYRVRATKGDLCTVAVFPETGRTHQIRVHFAHIGHPLYADALYGEAVAGQTYRLRCVSLTFPHPATGEEMTLRTAADWDADGTPGTDGV